MTSHTQRCVLSWREAKDLKLHVAKQGVEASHPTHHAHIIISEAPHDAHTPNTYRIEKIKMASVCFVGTTTTALRAAPAAVSRRGSKATARAAPSVATARSSTGTSGEKSTDAKVNTPPLLGRRSVFGAAVAAAAAAALTASEPASAASARVERRVIDDLALGEREQKYQEITLGYGVGCPNGCVADLEIISFPKSPPLDDEFDLFGMGYFVACRCPCERRRCMSTVMSTVNHTPLRSGSSGARLI